MNASADKENLAAQAIAEEDRLQVNSQLYTPISEPSTLNPQKSKINPQPSTLNPQPSTLNPLQP